jgi:Zn-finger protein
MDCPGNPCFVEKEGRRIKVCTNCTFPHQPENYDAVVAILKNKERNVKIKIGTKGENMVKQLKTLDA